MTLWNTYPYICVKARMDMNKGVFFYDKLLFIYVGVNLSKMFLKLLLPILIKKTLHYCLY